MEKNNRKYVLLAFIGTVASAPINATEWGIGFSTQSDEQTLYFPIKANDKLRIEPFLREKQRTYTEKYYYHNGNNYSNPEHLKSTQKFFDIGVGVFGITNIEKKSQMYYGARVSWQETKETYKSERFNNKSESNGYTFSPTIGFEYMLTDNILLGGEAEWVYHDISQSNNNINRSFERRDVQRSETNKRFIIRYIF